MGNNLVEMDGVILDDFDLRFNGGGNKLKEVYGGSKLEVKRCFESPGTATMR